MIRQIMMIAASATMLSFGAAAQKASTVLTVEVSSLPGDDLAGQPIEITQTDYDVSYGNLQLDGEGRCTVKVYEGNHSVSVDREGFDKVTKEFVIGEGVKEYTVTLTLTEQTRKPFALTAIPGHDPLTGENYCTVGWNVAPPAFYDDFESYDPFAINFGDWTGIDGDGEATAALIGNYPNRGVMQYCQIMAPLAVTPTWWYDYPVLRPCSGTQYAGFVRTSSGNPNDDWLISPAIDIDADHWLTFMAKAADRYEERFEVYVTEQVENPRTTDFERIDRGNYEGVTYEQWRKFEYDLADYAGKKVRFAIRYIGDAKRRGAFMLMVDDVYVGQKQYEEASKMQARRQRGAMRSPANPYETFEVYLDGEKAGETDGYTMTLRNLTPGKHTAGVEAIYRNGRSERSEIEFEVSNDNYAKVTIYVDALSILQPDNLVVNMLNNETGESIDVDIKGYDSPESMAKSYEGHIAALLMGEYKITTPEGAYESFIGDIKITGDQDFCITLEDRVIDPFNLRVDEGEGTAKVTWNLDRGYRESFEEYEDFATGEFGEWKTLDLDGQPVYPIALGSMSNIVSFPGSGDATNPLPIAPMVFNPWETTPPMLPTDPAIAAVDGDKSIIFFSPQMAKADKWLISPPLEVRAGTRLTISAKAYTSIYPEMVELWYSEGSDNPSDFKLLTDAVQLPAETWGELRVPLDGLEGEGMRFAVRYVSTDAFLAQVDDFRIESDDDDAAGTYIDYGNVVCYEIEIDGEKVAETKKPVYVIEDYDGYEHTVGVTAVYREKRSQTVTAKFGSGSGIETISAEDSAPTIRYDLSGKRNESKRGVTIELNRNNRGVIKINQD